MFRFWIFMAGLCNIAAVAVIASGAMMGMGNGGSHFAAQALILALLNVPLLAIAALLAATEGRRHPASTWLLNVAAAGYLVSIVILSFLVFPMVDTAQVLALRSAGMPISHASLLPPNAATPVSRLVTEFFPLLGRMAAGAFVIAWLALAASAFGFKRLRSDLL